MKRALILLGAATLLTGNAFAQADVIIKKRAQEIRDQNNVRQGVAPPSQPAQPMPQGGSDNWWNVWTNQAELRPYRRELQEGWANWRDYDGGGMCFGVSGWGTHSLDQVQAALADRKARLEQMSTDADGRVRMERRQIPSDRRHSTGFDAETFGLRSRRFRVRITTGP